LPDLCAGAPPQNSGRRPDCGATPLATAPAGALSNHKFYDRL